MIYPTTEISKQQLDHMIDLYDASYSYMSEARAAVSVGVDEISLDSASRWKRIWKYRTPFGYPLDGYGAVSKHSHLAADVIAEKFFGEDSGLDEADRHSFHLCIEACIWGALMADRLIPVATIARNSALVRALTVVSFPYLAARCHRLIPSDLGDNVSDGYRDSDHPSQEPDPGDGFE